jgi:peptide/nickel transport system permease protein
MKEGGQSIDIALERAARRRRNPLLEFLRRLFKVKRLGAAGFVISVLLLSMAIFANWIAPMSYTDQNLTDSLEAPNSTYWLGTDQLGRDLFSRIIFGARVSLIVAFSCVAGFLLIAIFLGMGTGYIGGKLDMLVQRFVDGWMTIPTLILLLALVSVLGQGMWQLILVLSIDRGISTSRVLRGEAMSLKQNIYVEAARSLGAGNMRIFLVHIVPNAFAPIIVMATINLGLFILAEASLSFLGYGIPPPFPSWGSMLSDSGLTYMEKAPWMAIWPGLALTLAVWAFNVLGDAIRDLLDPRLRGAS